MPSTAGSEQPQAFSATAKIVLVLLVLQTAVLVPYVGSRSGWWSGVLAWVVGAAVLVLALRFVRLDRTTASRPSRLLDWVAIASPQVAEYVRRVEATERCNAANAGLYSNANALLADYHPPGDEAAALPELEAPIFRPDERAVRIGLDDVCTEAAAALAAAAPELGTPSELATCLGVLYLDRFEHANLDEINALERSWKQQRATLVRPLATLMARHPVFELGHHDADRISTALEALGRDRLPTLAAVVEQVKQSPWQIVANMDVVARRFGFGSVDHTTWDEVAAPLSRCTYAAFPAAAAAGFAERLADASRRGTVAKHLELLYRDRFDRPNEALWATYQNDARLRADLADVLATSGPVAPEVGVDAASDGASSAGRRIERVLVALLDAVDRFDLDLLQAALMRVEAFWKLAVAYADDLVARDLPAAPDFGGPVASERFLAHVADARALPRSEADLGALDEPSLILPLLVAIATESIEAHLRRDGDRDGVATEVVSALATVSLGRYLMGDGGRPDLAAALARLSSRSAPVVAVLLATLWQRRARIDAGRSGKVSLAEIVREHRTWHAAAQAEFGADLCNDLEAALADHLFRGEWPTRLPIDWMLERLAERIIEESRTRRPGSAEHIDTFRQEIDRLVSSRSEISRHLDPLIEIIAQFDPHAADAERGRKLDDVIRALEEVRQRPLEELTAAVNELRRVDLEMQETVSTLDETDRAVGRSVEELELVDRSVVRSVDHLAEMDEELREAVERLLEAVPSTSSRFLITWSAGSGRVAELMRDLEHPEGTRAQLVGAYRWLTDDRTPYARLGVLPAGVNFDQFCERLRRDLVAVYRERRRLEPAAWGGKHPQVYVQQIANRVGQRVP